MRHPASCDRVARIGVPSWKIRMDVLRERNMNTTVCAPDEHKHSTA